MTSAPVLRVVLLSIGCLAVVHPASGAFGGDNNRVLLRDLSVLTLYHGQMTTSRRSQPVPQLKCVGGSAGCGSFTPQVVQCYNRGFDGYDVQWECKTDMDNAYRFGKIEVTCEGYDYADDAHVLRGSCGLEYMLDLTKEGHQQAHQGSGQHNYYGSNSHHHTSHQKSSSVSSSLIMLGIVAVVIYAVYKTCFSPSVDGAPPPYPGDTRGQHRAGPTAPPPPGFRDEYMPPGGGCSSSYDSTYTSGGYTGGARPGGGGFWTGAATGGLLGYMFGNRGNYGGYGGGHQRQRTGWFGGNSGWGGGNSWGTGTGNSWGGTGGGGGSYSSGGASTGTRTASGFGGTKRR